ncbi:DUF488 family protein [Hydrogenobacter hydrogenophilus]|uniref:DUF488 domain-containing protein n=1 Tax=Hydrogenobacter hydrogenophilus TaxID=35835 RepID=A0A285P1A8_9AQUI|nr:DUF488 domain-containing protein [Hydrogenobacter hydrogenophilus]SNZ15505.1 Protein of unknown function, DUF488 [Hydrogenobacter hydrogenophilus]
MGLFLIGYEKLKIEEFVKLLKEAGVDLLVDVRQNPWSRRPEFRSSSLSKALKTHGIDYMHIPELGSPKEIRKKDTATMLQLYRDHLRNQNTALETLKSLLSTRRVALMCYERDPLTCHRIVIARELLLRGVIEEFEDLRAKNLDLM